MNQKSSRSHAIFRIIVNNPEFQKSSFLDIVDLAGSEWIKKSQMNDKKSSEEMISINSSLLVLGKCISNLALKPLSTSQQLSQLENSQENPQKAKKIHIPFRDSLLTIILQDCLSGNCFLSLIVTISPDDYNVYESFSSLQFAGNVMKLEIEPVKHKEVVVSPT